MKILWVSQHRPLAAQERGLQKLFGDDVTIIRDPHPFADADEIIARMRAQNVDELVAVAPLTVIKALCKRGVRPLYAEMEPLHPDDAFDPDCCAEAKGRRSRFVRFRRIEDVKIVFSDFIIELKPRPLGR